MLTRASTTIRTSAWRSGHASESQPSEREQMWALEASGEAFTPMHNSVRIQRSAGRTQLSPPSRDEFVSAQTPLAAVFSTLFSLPVKPNICDDDCDYLSHLYR